MRRLLCTLLLCGCGASTNTSTDLPATSQATPSDRSTFVGRAKEFVARVRRNIEVVKTERDHDKLLALKAEVTKAHAELQQPEPDSEKQKDLQRYLENIAINFGVAVDFQIEYLALEQSPDAEKKKTAKEDAEMMINGAPKICDQADEILKSL